MVPESETKCSRVLSLHWTKFSIELKSKTLNKLIKTRIKNVSSDIKVSGTWDTNCMSEFWMKCLKLKVVFLTCYPFLFRTPPLLDLCIYVHRCLSYLSFLSCETSSLQRKHNSYDSWVPYCCICRICCFCCRNSGRTKCIPGHIFVVSVVWVACSGSINKMLSCHAHFLLYLL